MTVRIGHASIAENGKATGGTSGDQTGKEVLIRDWYNKPWNVLLRPVRPELAEESAVACEEACANPNIGYDQGGRNTLYAKAKAVQFDISAITDPCECDCSSLMHVCAIAGGANMTYGSNGCTTRTMVKAFAESGDYIKITNSDYLSSSKLLKRGDILVKEGSHTVMVLDNGADVAVEPPVKPPVVNLPLEDDATVYYSVRLPLRQKGMTRDAVRAMQFLLDAHGFDVPLFGTFNARTEAALMEFQRDFNLQVDGKCGPDTWSALLGLTGVG
jgi:peptidoglycan hydrolase-like protein with peptidoglycan-binding domain